MIFEGKCVKIFACGALRTPKRLLNLSILVKSAPKAPKKFGVFPGGSNVFPGGSADFGVFPGGSVPGGVKTTFMPLNRTIQH